ncbi:dynein axonemal intermediate chain 3 [Nothobranchius furzeri]|uniref:Dynein axonemal intermediate chain 3 n=2 Tax=Nothobranchius furzeri TaxID=105023 RepID=A0A8C6Q8G8_NOTFU|nr:WD repeat domain 63 [Nothobranchius furzeri]
MPPKRRKRSTSSARSKGKGKGRRSGSQQSEVNIDHPDDIFPVALTSATQELFGCCADEDITQKSTYKLLKKDIIMEDIKKRAETSDFSSVKQIVLDYPEEELLLVFDPDLTYGQSFYLVLTPEAKNRILAPPETVTPEPKGWISLGSEKEIDEESVKETREKLKILVQKVHRRFGQPFSFSDSTTTDNILEIPSENHSRFSIKLMQRDVGIQPVTVLQNDSTQTHRSPQRNNFSQYSPRQLSNEELKSILQDESLKSFCNKVTPRILKALQEGEIAKDPWKSLETEFEDDGARQISGYLELYFSFRDPKCTTDKKISCMNWHPTIDGVMAVALIDNMQTKNKEATITVPLSRPAFIIFYSLSDKTIKLLLESPDDVWAFEFCPSNPNIIAGGCVNGQVLLWDISAYTKHLQEDPSGSNTTSNKSHIFNLNTIKENKAPVLHVCAMSAIESSHKAPITDLHWLPQTFEVTDTGLPVENELKTSVHIVTCSPDCTIMFWSMRAPQRTDPIAYGNQPNVNERTATATSSMAEMFKHLDGTWKPLFRISPPKIDSPGKYVPLKFNLDNYPNNDNTEETSVKEGAESTTDNSQLYLPASKTLKILKEINTKFYFGTESGELVYTDWKLEKDEFGRLCMPKPLQCFPTHHWLVNSIQRSPFFKDIILTVGGWNFAIWKEGVMSGPLVKSPYSDQECSAGCWSQTRSAVFFIGKEDGNIEVWNLLEDSHKPSQIFPLLTNTKITCMKPWTLSPKEHFLAVTTDHGVLHVFRISKALYTRSKHESLNLKNFFEWETEAMKREENWSKQQKQREEVEKIMDPDRLCKTLMDSGDLDLQNSEYLKLEKHILGSIGLEPAAASHTNTHTHTTPNITQI